MLIQTLPFAPVIAIRSLHAAMHVKASALHAEVLDFMPHACNLVPDSFFAAIHATIYVVLFVHRVSRNAVLGVRMVHASQSAEKTSDLAKKNVSGSVHI